VVIFSHGWSGTNPKHYGAWIEHLVRRGNIVVYPLYQDPGFKYPPNKILGNAVAAIQSAVAELQSGGHVRPDLSRVAYVGHSAGGQLSANLAAVAGRRGLPSPRAVVCVQPGRSETRSERVAIPLEDLDRIPRGTLLLTIAGEADRVVRDVDAKKIFYGAAQVPLEDKDFVQLVGDDHGEPALSAGHFAPVAIDETYDDGVPKGRPDRGGLLGRGREQRDDAGPVRQWIRERVTARLAGRARDRGGQDGADAGFDLAEAGAGPRSVNAMDYYGTWKLVDGLCDAAFYGRNRPYALGNTPEQRHMGFWSDGTPVNELLVTDEP
jgi:dienelactone hydrolase